MRKFEMSTWFDKLSKNSISLSFVRSFVANLAYIVNPFSLKMRLSTSSQILKIMFSFSGVKNSQIGVRILGDCDFIMGSPGMSASKSISLMFGGMMNLYSSSWLKLEIEGNYLWGFKRSYSKHIFGDFDTKSSCQWLRTTLVVESLNFTPDNSWCAYSRKD